MEADNMQIVQSARYDNTDILPENYIQRALAAMVIGVFLGMGILVCLWVIIEVPGTNSSVFSPSNDAEVLKIPNNFILRSHPATSFYQNPGEVLSTLSEKIPALHGDEDLITFNRTNGVRSEFSGEAPVTRNSSDYRENNVKSDLISSVINTSLFYELVDDKGNFDQPLRGDDSLELANTLRVRRNSVSGVNSSFRADSIKTKKNMTNPYEYETKSNSLVSDSVTGSGNFSSHTLQLLTSHTTTDTNNQLSEEFARPQTGMDEHNFVDTTFSVHKGIGNLVSLNSGSNSIERESQVRTDGSNNKGSTQGSLDDLVNKFIKNRSKNNSNREMPGLTEGINKNKEFGKGFSVEETTDSLIHITPYMDNGKKLPKYHFTSRRNSEYGYGHDWIEYPRSYSLTEGKSTFRDVADVPENIGQVLKVLIQVQPDLDIKYNNRFNQPRLLQGISKDQNGYFNSDHHLRNLHIPFSEKIAVLNTSYRKDYEGSLPSYSHQSYYYSRQQPFRELLEPQSSDLRHLTDLQHEDNIQSKDSSKLLKTKFCNWVRRTVNPPSREIKPIPTHFRAKRFVTGSGSNSMANSMSMGMGGMGGLGGIGAMGGMGGLGGMSMSMAQAMANSNNMGMGYPYWPYAVPYFG